MQENRESENLIIRDPGVLQEFADFVADKFAEYFGHWRVAIAEKNRWFHAALPVIQGAYATDEAKEHFLEASLSEMYHHKLVESLDQLFVELSRGVPKELDVAQSHISIWWNAFQDRQSPDPWDKFVRSAIE